MGSIKKADKACLSRINRSWLGRTIAALGASMAILTSSMPTLAQQPITGTYERKAVQVWNPTVEGGCHYKEKLRPQFLNDMVVTGITQNKIFDSGFSFVDHKDISNPYYTVSVVVNAPDKNCDNGDYNVTAKIYSRATHNTFGVIKAFNAACSYSSFENCVKDMFRQEVKDIKETPEQRSMGLDWSRGPYGDKDQKVIQDKSPVFKKFVDMIIKYANMQRIYSFECSEQSRNDMKKAEEELLEYDDRHIKDVDLSGNIRDAFLAMEKHGYVYVNATNNWAKCREPVTRIDIGEMILSYYITANNWGEEKRFFVTPFKKLFKKIDGISERAYFISNRGIFINSDFVISKLGKIYDEEKMREEKKEDMSNLPFLDLINYKLYMLGRNMNKADFLKKYYNEIRDITTDHHEAVHLDEKYRTDEVKAYLTEVAYSTPASVLDTLRTLEEESKCANDYCTQAAKVMSLIAEPAREEKLTGCAGNRKCKKRVNDMSPASLLREMLFELPISGDSSFHQYCMDAASEAHKRLYGVGK